jgi:hypothetical protein
VKRGIVPLAMSQSSRKTIQLLPSPPYPMRRHCVVYRIPNPPRYCEVFLLLGISPGEEQGQTETMERNRGGSKNRTAPLLPQ